MRKFNLVGKVKPSEKYWWLNDESRTMLTRGYALEGEEVKDMVIRITTAAANKVGIEGLQPLFQECIERGWWSFSSPIWANMGAPRGLPISCYSVYFADNLPDILAKGTEVGMQMGLGGGTSGYYGALRGRGEAITNNGKTNGPISFMKRQNTDVDVISQGGIRRGAFAAYLDINHPDIKEFLTIKDIGSDIQNLFTGVCISDKWMEEMEAGDREKRSLWAKVLESRQQKGLPYLFFSDNVNRQAPEVYKIKNKTVWGSNLCVAGDTKITTLSDKGIKDLTIQEVSGTSQTVWNGESWSLAKVEKTGEDQKLYKVKVKLISSGEVKETFVDCTDYHKWYNHRKEELRTSDLVPGMVLESYIDPKTDAVVTPEVEEIVLLEGTHDTYCLNEPIRHKTLFNGILTGQCSEITLSTDEQESFICCLSSLNAALYDEWKDTDAPYLLTMFLDAVISDYIEKTEGMPFMETTRRFAIYQRAIGIGILGYHSYLQKNMIPFESFEAKAFNVEIFKLIQEQSKQASKDLGELLGYAPIFDGVEGIEKYRNVTTMAVAPTTSSSSILGQVSPGIEPFSSNYYKAGLAKGNFMRKNKELEKLLETKGKNTEEVWRSIMMSGGSVLHLDFLTDHEKNVFKTFKEISQVEILNQAVSRQRFIDQAQSLNLNIPADVPLKDVNRMIMDYWRNGGKTLYYQRSQSVAKELITNLVTCSSCEA